jgi:hypothetical protein
MTNDLFVLHLRIERALDLNAIIKAVEVEELLDDIKKVAATPRPAAEATAIAAWLNGTKDKGNLTLQQRVEWRLRERRRFEQEVADREAFIARNAQRDHEARMRPTDHGRPGYARGA